MGAMEGERHALGICQTVFISDRTASRAKGCERSAWRDRITLSDGRLVRATLHVKSVKVDPKKPDAIEVSYNVIAEIMATPEMPIRDVHETVQ